MTSHGDLKAMNGNAVLTPTSFLYMQKDFQQDVGHSSDLGQKRSGSHSKIKADDEFGLAMQREESQRACLYCIRKPRENQICKSNTSELVE